MDHSPAIKAYYDQLAEDYEADRFHNSYGQYLQKQELAVLEKYLNSPATEPCLDLACGSGRYLKFATHGCDISPKMIAVAKAQHPDVDFQIGDARSLAYPEEHFHNCLSFHLMMHLEADSLKQILAEVQRVLKPGGRFIFDIPSAKRRKLINYKAEGWHGAFSLSVKEIRSLLGANWQFETYHGIALLPVHRIPKKLRPTFRLIDTFLSRLFLKEYASHLVIVLKKQQ